VTLSLTSRPPRIQIYGEAEFIFASIKIITIVGLLILAFIVDLGGSPSGHRLGFQFWKNPGAMLEYDGTGDTGRFLGLWSVLVNAAFSYGGVELVAVAAGEAENPRKNSKNGAVSSECALTSQQFPRLSAESFGVSYSSTFSGPSQLAFSFPQKISICSRLKMRVRQVPPDPHG